MAGIPIDDIKSSVKIYTLIEKYYQDRIQLRKSGSVYKGLCPFHKEQTPSFVVWPEKNRWKCFGECEIGGDVIDFIVKMENLSFKEACRMAADEAGIVYVETPPNPVHEAYKDLMDSHTRRYWKNLQGNTVAMSYLTNTRKLTQESITQFRLGLVPADEYKIRTDLGGISTRLSFPIMENKDEKYAKCIGMGYRQFDSKDRGPKYINEKNHEDDIDPLKGVFVKGDCLYGYPFAYQEIRKKNHVIITEGYLDVISLHQSGLKNSVGCMGTALTDSQMDQLRKLTRNVILFLDGDNAGVLNMFKKLPDLFDRDFNVMIVIADEGMDAAEVCVKNNFDYNAITSYITKKAKSAMMSVIERSVDNYEQTVVRERMKALREVSPLLEKIKSQGEKDVFKDMLYKRLDIKGGGF